MIKHEIESGKLRVHELAAMDRSLCEYFYEPSGVEGHTCGYCKGTDTNVSNGMWAHQLTCEDYQDLIDRGWRRSGKYCYKPVMDRTCCPLYAIRCEAPKFQLSKSQKKVLKAMNDYLAHGKRKEKKETSSQSASQPESTTSQNNEKHEGASSSKSDASLMKDDGASKSDSILKKDDEPKQKKIVREGVGADPTKPPCRKAKVIRLGRKHQKLAASKDTAKDADKHTEAAEETKEVDTENENSTTKTETEHKLPKSKALKNKDSDQTPDFLKIGPDGRKPLEMFLTPTTLPTDAITPPQVGAHTLEITLVRSSPPSPEFEATYKESFKLFQKYQMDVHNDTEDKCDEKMFKRFLCDSPLMPKGGASDWSCDYGSYHQHYRIDGKLVAVGVVDILPKCLSSVYVFYDPDYNFLSLGVYTALRELELTRKLHLSDPDRFVYYCMGYYVHQCQKMRYKGQYSPSFLLCPVTYRYVPIESCRPKLDVNRFSRFYEGSVEIENVEGWLANAIVMFQRNLLPYGMCRMLFGSEHDDKVKEYAHFVGPNVASRMVLFLS